MELNDLAHQYHCDKRVSDEMGPAHGYTPVYQQLFGEQRLEYKNVLEIGVWDGRSLRMWYDYFPNAMIWGVDNMNAVGCLPPEQINNDRIKFLFGRQEDKEFLDSSFSNVIFDLIIDDGSHQSWSHQLTFKYLFPRLKHGGLYIIEDLDTCLLREFREVDDERSTTTAWLESFRTGNPFSYYMSLDDMKDINGIERYGELGVIYKK
jgi:hypothetical protein